ncbi:hypothetical protein ACNKHV_19290 [Shigella flexneri]
MTNVRRVFNELIGDDESETQEESLWDSGVSCGRMRCRKMTRRVLAHLSEDNREQVLT